MASTPRPTGQHIHDLLKGRLLSGLAVTAQAYRLRDDGSDEVSIVTDGRQYWVAARLDDRFTIWACADLETAQVKLEQLTPVDASWIHARRGDPTPELAA